MSTVDPDALAREARELVGETVVFPAGNAIAFWQDFGGHRGLPGDRPFKIVGYCDGHYSLRARGYGILNGQPSDYGNGAVSVRAEDVVAARAALRGNGEKAV